MPEVAIIDYRLCNIDSIARAIVKQGATVDLVRTAGRLSAASHIVLPGVGAFPAAMRNLVESGLADELRGELARRHVPMLGICLGMQLLAEIGHEHEAVAGLGLVPGEVRKLEPGSPDERVPHVGWNAVVALPGSPLFEGIEPGTDFYFVHSYHFACPAGNVAARTPACGGIVSSVRRENIYGTQFHPEKSQKPGQRVLRNFLAIGQS